MADTIKNSNQLKLVAQFADGDDCTLIIDHPKNTVTATQIRKLERFAAVALVGDKAGASFTSFGNATLNQTTATKLDISST